MKIELIDVVRNYGPSHSNVGVLSENVLVAQADIKVLASGSAWAVPLNGGRAFPILCSEIIEVQTSEGPTEGRCGRPVEWPSVCCGDHAEDYKAKGISTIPVEYEDY